MLDVVASTSEEIVDTQDITALLQESLTQVRAQKAGTASDKYPFSYSESAAHRSKFNHAPAQNAYDGGVKL
jgi:hypothetical protein